MKNKIIEQLHQLTEEYKLNPSLSELKHKLKLLTYNLDSPTQKESLKENKKIFSKAKPVNSLVNELLNKFKNDKEGYYKYNLTSGFNELDEITYGFGKGEIIIIGGRPGMGKTSLMVQFASNIAESGKIVMFYSFDLPEEQILTKLIAGKTGIATNSINQFKITDEEHLRLFNMAKDIEELSIFIVGNPEHNIYDFIEQCRLDLIKIKPEIIFIDYLQLIGDMRRHYDRDEELSLLMRELKAIAKLFNIPIVIGSQLSREVEMRGGDKKPILSDLRSSGSIEDEADKVILVYRPEYYKMNTDMYGNSTLGLMELIVAKNKSGFLSSAILNYDNHFTHFTDFDKNISISNEEIDD